MLRPRTASGAGSGLYWPRLTDLCVLYAPGTRVIMVRVYFDLIVFYYLICSFLRGNKRIVSGRLILPMEESEGGKKGVSIDLNDCFLNETFARCVLFNWKFEVRKNVKFEMVI